MLETKADVNENVMSALNGIVYDEGHWVTINGRHVLINEKGEVQAGMGGRLNGVKISNFKGKPTGEQLKKAKTDADAELKKKQDDANAKRNEFFKLHRYYELKNKLNSDYGEILPPAEKNKIRAKLRRIEEKAREKFDPEVQEVDKAWNKQMNLRNATDPDSNKFKGKNNLVRRNLTAEKKSIIAQRNNIESSFNKRINGLERKQNETLEKYNKAAERVKKAGIGGSEFGYNDFANSIERRGREKAQAFRQEQANLEGRKTLNQLKNMRKSKEIHEKLLPAQETLAKGRAKLKSAREANEFVKQQAKGTRISKATPDMMKGKFRNLLDEDDKAFEIRGQKIASAQKGKNKLDNEHEKEYKKIRTAQRRLDKLDRKSGTDKYEGLIDRLEQKKEDVRKAYEQRRVPFERKVEAARNEYKEKRAEIRKKEDAAKATLAKARPKIAERRQAVKAFNEKNAPKEASSKVVTRFDKDMAKAEKSYEDFKDVMNRRKNEIDVLRERLRTTKNGFIAKATAQDLEKRIKEYNELDEMY